MKKHHFIAALTLCCVFFVYTVFLELKGLKDRKTKIENLYLVGSGKKVCDRHVQIVENFNSVSYHTNYIPAHILYRNHVTNTWRMVGSATILRKYENCFLSAYHVFEDKPGYYGIRAISKDALYGLEKVIPVVSVVVQTNIDDAILGVFDSFKGTYFEIDVPISKTRFKDFEDSVFLECGPFRSKITSLTYPQDTINGLFYLNVSKGVQYVFMDNDFERGESGSGLLVQGGPEGSIVVAVRSVSFNDKEISEILGISRRKSYGVGLIVKVH